jgi:hypothetical protein
VSVVLSATEVACGVTVEDVERYAARSLVMPNGRVVVDDVAPALAGAVAKARLGGEVEFLGFNILGLPVYGRAR